MPAPAVAAWTALSQPPRPLPGPAACRPATTRPPADCAAARCGYPFSSSPVLLPPRSLGHLQAPVADQVERRPVERVRRGRVGHHRALRIAHRVLHLDALGEV